jgi:hypothetical protein
VFNKVSWKWSKEMLLWNATYICGRYIECVDSCIRVLSTAVAYPGIVFGGGSTNSVEDRGQRGRGSGGGSPLVRGSGCSCNLVQGILVHIVKDS